MKKITLFLMILLLVACDDDQFLTMSKVIDGNTIQLDNGITVSLAGVSKNPQNIPVIRKYLSGHLVIMDQTRQPVEDFNTDHISAFVFNADGDEINRILEQASHITEHPVTRLPGPEVSAKTVVKAVREDGVLKIPAEINGNPLYFIFDTGASLISLSANEAAKLYTQKSLTAADFIGKSKFQDANGGLSEGDIVNLSTVRIGNRLLRNVQAVINANQDAPLLFGESAMQKFGKVSIDYQKNEITFE